MRKILLICVFQSMSFCVFPQKECLDVIYAIEGNKVIFNCCIKDIRQDNVIIYEKDGEVDGIEAYAVMIDDEYIELYQPGKISGNEGSKKAYYTGHYKGHSYSYYESLYLGARMRAGFGKVITISGIVMAGYGLIFLNPRYDGGDYIFLGSLIVSAGLPLWISGGIRADNNHRAMEEIKKSTDISLSLNPHGIGLVYRF